MERRTDEVMPDFRFENDRLSSFEDGVWVSPRLRLEWPHTIPSYKSVAADGFYYTPTAKFKDRVTCFECGKKVKDLTGVTSVATFHLFNRPQCTSALLNSCLHLGRTNLKNSAFWETLVEEGDAPYVFVNPVADQSTSLRISTFKGRWKSNTPGGKANFYRKMAQAGFFFAPRGPTDDRVICVYCGCTLDKWDERGDPLHEHEIKSKEGMYSFAQEKCYFLAMLEESSDVDMVCAAGPENGDILSGNPLPPGPPASKDSDSSETNLCNNDKDEDDAMILEELDSYGNIQLARKKLSSEESLHVCRDQPRTSNLWISSKIDALRRFFFPADPHSFADNDISPESKVSNGIANIRKRSASVSETSPGQSEMKRKHESSLSAPHDLAQEQIPFETQNCDAVEMHSTRGQAREAKNTHPATEADDVGGKTDFEVSEDSHKPILPTSEVEIACHKSSQDLATQAIGFLKRPHSMPASVNTKCVHCENRSQSSSSSSSSSAQSISASSQQVPLLCLPNQPVDDMRFERMANIVSHLRSLGYELHNDVGGRLTSFLAEMPDSEKNMTFEEWHDYINLQFLEEHERFAESVGQSVDNRIDELMSIIANSDHEMDLTEIFEWVDQLYDSHV